MSHLWCVQSKAKLSYTAGSCFSLLLWIPAIKKIFSEILLSCYIFKYIHIINGVCMLSPRSISNNCTLYNQIKQALHYFEQSLWPFFEEETCSLYTMQRHFWCITIWMFDVQPNSLKTNNLPNIDYFMLRFTLHFHLPSLKAKTSSFLSFCIFVPFFHAKLWILTHKINKAFGVLFALGEQEGKTWGWICIFCLNVRVILMPSWQLIISNIHIKPLLLCLSSSWPSQ